MEERQDLISRQVAIDALRDAENHAFNSFYKGLAKAHKIIADLPSAQPATSCSEIPNGSDDTISRQAAIDALARMMPRSYTPDGSHPGDEEISGRKRYLRTVSRRLRYCRLPLPQLLIQLRQLLRQLLPQLTIGFRLNESYRTILKKST